MNTRIVRTMTKSLLMGCLILGLYACGDDNNVENEENPASTKTGRTQCGEVGGDKQYCEANRYCADQILSRCADGCASNNNCAEDQTCVKSAGEDFGSCMNKTTGGGGGGGGGDDTTTTGRCNKAAERGGSCSVLTPQEVAALKAFCADMDPDAQIFAKAIADCTDAVSETCGADLETCFE